MQLISLLPCTKSAGSRPYFLKHTEDIEVLPAVRKKLTVKFIFAKKNLKKLGSPHVLQLCNGAI
jgi:hypothetical protein